MNYNVRKKEYSTPFTVSFYGQGIAEAAKTVKTWTKTKVQNLVRHRNGVYYARLYSKGKEQWKSLRTELLEVAKAWLREQCGGNGGERCGAGGADSG